MDHINNNILSASNSFQKLNDIQNAAETVEPNEFFAKANKTIQNAFIEPPKNEAEFKDRIKVLKNVREKAVNVFKTYQKNLRKSEGPVDRSGIKTTVKEYNKLMAELDKKIPHEKESHLLMKVHKEISLPYIGSFIDLIKHGGKYVKIKHELRVKAKQLERLQKNPEENLPKIKWLEKEVDILIEKLDDIRDHVVTHSLKSGDVVLSLTSDAVKTSQRFVSGLATVGSSLGVGTGVLGIIINSKLLYKNRKKAIKIDENLTRLEAEQINKSEALQKIIEIRKKNLELQKKDNLVNTILNSASMVSSVIGTTAGALAIAAVAAAGLAAIAASLGYAALAVGLTALTAGAIYLGYKNRKVISLYLRKKAVQIKEKFADEKDKQVLNAKAKKLETSFENERVRVGLDGVSKKEVKDFRQELRTNLENPATREEIFQFLAAEGAIRREDLEQNVMKYILSRAK